jgi:hypothetical protein
MNRTWTRTFIGVVALLFGMAACGGGGNGSGGSATTRVGELRAAGDKLAAGPYKVDFTVEYFDLYAWTWSGTMTTTGTSWAASTDTTGDNQGAKVDAGHVDIVDAGDKRYLRTPGTTWSGKPWLAVTGGNRQNYIGRPHLVTDSSPAGGSWVAVGMPDIDPRTYLDISGSTGIDRTPREGGGFRYVVPGAGGLYTAGDRLSAALALVGSGAQGATITAEVNEAGLPTTVRVTFASGGSGKLQDLVIRMAVREAGTPNTVTPPAPGTFEIGVP